MGRFIEALKQADLKHRPSADITPSASPGRTGPEAIPAPESSEEIPFIEVGAVGRKPEVSPPALAGVGHVPSLFIAAGERAVRRFLEFLTATIRNKNTRALPLLWGTRSRTPWPDVFDHWNGLTIVIVYNLIWPGSRPTHVDPWIRGRRLDMETIRAHSDGLEQNRQRGRQFGPA